MENTLAKPVLLTGFEPFFGASFNPSWDIVSALHGEWIGGHMIVAQRLPVSFAKAPPLLREMLLRYDPVLTICTGVDNLRGRMALERVAVNLMGPDGKDNDGVSHPDLPLVAGAPAAYFSRLPLRRMEEGLRQAGCRVGISLSAGAYLCNAAFYTLMHAIADRPDVQGGFIHLPHPKESALWWHRPFAKRRDVLIDGMRTCIEIALDAGAHARNDSAGAAAGHSARG